MFHFYTSRKHLKIFGFLTFSGGKETEHWDKILGEAQIIFFGNYQEFLVTKVKKVLGMSGILEVNIEGNTLY